MDNTLQINKKCLIKSWIQLTKPGIIMGNLLTGFAGFMLAKKTSFIPLMMLLIGLGLIIASACVFNNIIDEKLDSMMKRTSKRPLPQKTIAASSATIFGILLGILGSLILYLFTNSLALILAFCGWVFYVGVYSMMKYETSFATWVGSIAGAIPPLVGYSAATARLDLIALILFAIVALWQIPHFLSIGMYRMEDYANGSIPIFPCICPSLLTKGQMLFYLIGFLLACWMLYVVAQLHILFLLIIGGIGILWTKVALEGFFIKNDVVWAKKMFLYSLISITAFSIILPFSGTNNQRINSLPITNLQNT